MCNQVLKDYRQNHFNRMSTTDKIQSGIDWAMSELYEIGTGQGSDVALPLMKEMLKELKDAVDVLAKAIAEEEGS